MNYNEGVIITNIRQGKGARSDTVYAELQNKEGEIVMAATFELILHRLMGKNSELVLRIDERGRGINTRRETDVQEDKLFQKNSGSIRESDRISVKQDSNYTPGNF